MSRRRGQAMVEWVLVLPAALMLTFAVCEWCLIQLHQNLVSHAAWHSARAQLVGEDPWDAAAIILSPVAGFTDTLIGRTSDGAPWNFPAETTGPILPGWGELERARRLNLHRLNVQSLEDDWDKVTSSVSFQVELLFPFVEAIFAQSRSSRTHLQLQTVPLNSTDEAGIAQTSSDFGQGIVQARNFVTLTATATVPRIDRPPHDEDLTSFWWPLIRFNSQIPSLPSPFPGRDSAPTPWSLAP